MSERDKEYHYEHKEKRNQQSKEDYYAKKEYYNQKSKEYYEAHKEELRAKKRKYHEENKEKEKEYREKTKEQRKEYIREYMRDKANNNISFKVVKNLRVRLNAVIKNGNKSKSTLDLIGCSVEDLMKHLESKFQEGMSWDNYGRKGWHIDHIRPCASFDLLNEEEQKICFNYSNLQPLWAIDNLRKSDKWNIEGE